jgi:hypothetical protein
MFFNNSNTMHIEAEIEDIKLRNRRVEADKAWETSNVRRAIIFIGTYIATYLVFLLIDAPNPHLAALVPAVGFLLSTLTMPVVKQSWLRNRK